MSTDKLFQWDRFAGKEKIHLVRQQSGHLFAWSSWCTRSCHQKCTLMKTHSLLDLSIDTIVSGWWIVQFFLKPNSYKIQSAEKIKWFNRWRMKAHKITNVFQKIQTADFLVFFLSEKYSLKFFSSWFGYQVTLSAHLFAM